MRPEESKNGREPCASAAFVSQPFLAASEAPVPAREGAMRIDFEVSGGAAVYLFKPLTRAARAWIAEHLPEGATWCNCRRRDPATSSWCGAVVVENCYIGPPSTSSPRGPYERGGPSPARAARVRRALALASAKGARARVSSPGRRVNVQPEPGSTPGLETLRNHWRGRRLGDSCHPRQWLLRYEVRASPRVGDDGRSQIGSAVAAEIAAVADVGPELLRRVGPAACLAARHRMVRTQREEQ